MLIIWRQRSDIGDFIYCCSDIKDQRVNLFCDLLAQSAGSAKSIFKHPWRLWRYLISEGRFKYWLSSNIVLWSSFLYCHQIWNFGYQIICWISNFRWNFFVTILPYMVSKGVLSKIVSLDAKPFIQLIWSWQEQCESHKKSFFLFSKTFCRFSERVSKQQRHLKLTTRSILAF